MNEDKPNRFDDASAPNKVANAIENAQPNESLSKQDVVDTPSHLTSNHDANTNTATIQPESTMPEARVQTDPSNDVPNNANEPINATDTGTDKINSTEADNGKDETPMPPTEPIPAPAGWSPKKKSFFNLGLLIALIVIGVALILYAWKLPPFTPSVQQTNNAFVKGQTTIISPQVSGYLTEVAVKDFANVAAGDLVVEIDDELFSSSLNKHRRISILP